MRTLLSYWTAFFLAIVHSCAAWANDWSVTNTQHTENYNLQDQFASDAMRILPHSDLYTLGVEGWLFYLQSRPDNSQYYHSGNWINGFMELRPFKGLTLNWKLVAYNPGTSFGYVSTSKLHSFPAIVFYSDDLLPFDLKWRLRLLDLDRQNLGAGLTLEQKEMSAVNMEIWKGNYRFRYLQDGTGGYDYSGDLQYLQLDYREDLVGLYAFTYHDDHRLPFYGAYSRHPLTSVLSYRTEVSNRNTRWAGLAAIHVKGSPAPWLDADSEASIRGYSTRYATGIVGHVQQDYFTIEKLDLPMDDSMNIFSIDDGVSVPSLQTNLNFFPRKKWRAFFDSELTFFNFERSPRRHYFFYKVGGMMCPIAGRDECIDIFATNKFLNSGQDANFSDLTTRPLFVENYYVGGELKFRF